MFNKKRASLFLIGMTICFTTLQISAQSDYRNYSKLTQKIKSLQKSNAANAKLEALTTTIGGHKIWALTLSKGNAENKPAIAIVSGVDGSHILGPEMAVNIADNILKNHANVLEKTTFYIFPNMSPNATENYFSSLKHYKNGNAKKTDDDRDGAVNEDSFDDLNNDGLITMMRVKDITGAYTTLKEDDRVLVKADINKGEKGTYKLLSEGIDNDKDGAFNEDGKGGILFNKNFSYNYQYFTPGAGEHPVSEKENRDLLSFLYDRWNIFAIVTLGPENNLSTPLKYSASGAKKRVVTSVLKEDAALNKFLSDKYNKIIKAKNAPSSKGKGGDFFQWSYFHFGKLALSTPGWWVPQVKDSAKKASKNKVVNYLRWAEKENIKNAFVDWTTVSHPDFPNKKVEVGGIAPYKMINPPYKLVADISKKHTDFIIELAKIQPNITLQNLTSEAVGNGITRITVDVHNSGLLPTHTEMGKRSRWLRKIKVAIGLKKNQEIISGKEITLLNSIDGDSSVQFSWLIKGNGSVTLEAGTSHTGVDSVTIKLK
ncbi:peptidase [Polaribacter sp. BM10]|uniref:M14 family metallopeptidase n=1 Tax=Polaribacter sp. BM10 TaxID=1529069 RepID=UPI00098A6757|nr:M14 family metallopeptidase [Polaribacter sp. BM10]AQS93185.1 peptidase [Polaribacter sp. BM10]